VAQDNEARELLENPQPTIQSFDTWASDPNPPYEVEEEDEALPAPAQPKNQNLNHFNHNQ
jgi:hypothetical protein